MLGAGYFSQLLAVIYIPIKSNLIILYAMKEIFVTVSGEHSSHQRTFT